jgi:nucleotide-binding universal stress UspA family protein
MTTKILCAVDDSEHATVAIQAATKIAKAMGAELTLLTVNQLMSGPGGVGAYVWTDSEVNDILENAAAAAKKAGFSEPKIVTVKARDTAGAIAIYAENNGFDHIVVGTGGKNAISRLILGSVSRDVVARAHSTVTVAR